MDCGEVRNMAEPGEKVRYSWSNDEIKGPRKCSALFGPALSFHCRSLSNPQKIPENLEEPVKNINPKGNEAKWH